MLQHIKFHYTLIYSILQFIQNNKMQFMISESVFE